MDGYGFHGHKTPHQLYDFVDFTDRDGFCVLVNRSGITMINRADVEHARIDCFGLFPATSIGETFFKTAIKNLEFQGHTRKLRKLERRYF